MSALVLGQLGQTGPLGRANDGQGNQVVTPSLALDLSAFQIPAGSIGKPCVNPATAVPQLGNVGSLGVLWLQKPKLRRAFQIDVVQHDAFDDTALNVDLRNCVVGHSNLRSLEPQVCREAALWVAQTVANEVVRLDGHLVGGSLRMLPSGAPTGNEVRR